MKKVMLIPLVLLTFCKSSTNSSNSDEIINTEHIVNEFNLIEKNILNNKLKILLPDFFEIMPKKLAEVKYPSGNRPTEIYSNNSGTISIGFNHTNTPMKVTDLEKALPAFVNQFAQIYPTIKWMKKGLVKINNVDYILLEFETPSIDTRIYNLMVVTSLNKRMLISTFNCMIKQKEKWEEKANKIIYSINIR